MHALTWGAGGLRGEGQVGVAPFNWALVLLGGLIEKQLNVGMNLTTFEPTSFLNSVFSSSVSWTMSGAEEVISRYLWHLTYCVT